jgi:hypothetical protein
MMNKEVLKTTAYPKMMKEFIEENFDLKVLVTLLSMFLMMSMATTVYLAKRGPTVIALDSAGEVTKVDTKMTDLQVMAAIKEYIRHRYTWDEKTVTAELLKAKFFVLPSLVQSFDKAMVDVQKFVHDKKVSQRVYPKNIEIDWSNKKAVLSADRVTEFESLKAATEMHLTLQFSIDDRTVLNPWGVYIVKESEVTQ